MVGGLVDIWDLFQRTMKDNKTMINVLLIVSLDLNSVKMFNIPHLYSMNEFCAMEIAMSIYFIVRSMDYMNIKKKACVALNDRSYSLHVIKDDYNFFLYGIFATIPSSRSTCQREEIFQKSQRTWRGIGRGKVWRRVCREENFQANGHECVLGTLPDDTRICSSSLFSSFQPG